MNDTITLAGAAKLYPLAYSTLAQAAREGRLACTRSGSTWLTTLTAIEQAIEDGSLRPREVSVRELAEMVWAWLQREAPGYPESKRAELLAWMDHGDAAYERSNNPRQVAYDWMMYDQ
jgi:hypothetical protein